MDYSNMSEGYGTEQIPFRSAQWQSAPVDYHYPDPPTRPAPESAPVRTQRTRSNTQKRLPKAQALALVRHLKQTLVVGSLLCFGTTSGLINNELHNFLTLLGLVFTVVHVLAVWIDPFTSLGWNEIFIPLASSYHPWWMAMGIVGLYLGIAIGISTWLRPHIGYTWWRRLHYATLLIYLLVTAHSIGIGTDTRTPWAIALYAGSALLVGILLFMRITRSMQARTEARAGKVSRSISSNS